jgi:hypothetical protein
LLSDAAGHADDQDAGVSIFLCAAPARIELEGIGPVVAARRLIVFVPHPFDDIAAVDDTAGHAVLHARWSEVNLASEIVKDQTKRQLLLAFGHKRPSLNDWTSKQRSHGREGIGGAPIHAAALSLERARCICNRCICNGQ